MTRNGKIARLPKEIREELNRRLQNGEPMEPLANWLNRKKQVRAVLKAHFEGKPVREQNISEWKNGGYVEWEQDEESQMTLRQLRESADGLNNAMDGAEISDCFARILATKMTALARTLLDKESDPEKQWERLCEVSKQLSRFRRDDHRGLKTMIKRERWERELDTLEEAEVVEPLQKLSEK